MYAVETIGREGQARAKRKLDAKDADKALKALLHRDRDGMKAVNTAREAAKLEKVDAKGKKKDESGKAKGKAKAKRKSVSDDDEDEPRRELHKTSYSAGVIKSLGFDPSCKPGQRKSETRKNQDKVSLTVLSFGRVLTASFPAAGGSRGSSDF